MQLLDADNFLPVLNAASKVNEVPAIIVIKQKEMKESFKLKKTVTKEAIFPASKVFQVPAIIVITNNRCRNICS